MITSSHDRRFSGQRGISGYLGFGTNLGDRKQNLAQAINRLNDRPDFAIIRTSNIYETEPWGVTNQPNFLNMVAEITTSLDPHQLLERIKKLEKEVSEQGQMLNEQIDLIPNVPHDTVPVGQDENANQVIREWGEPAAADFDLKSHVEIGLELNLFDLERGSKISGSGFPLLTGLGAKLERVLINYMLELHVQKHGFTEIFPPFLTRAEAPRTCGQLPKFADDMYYIEKDDLYLIPTAEVPVTNIFSDEIIAEDDLPGNYAAYSACFRREAGSYGKDTHGLLRLHQFNKVEMVKFVEPKTSYDELESITSQAEEVLQQLGLHYRVVVLNTSDLSFAAAKCYDLEVWAPGEGKWLEVSSCSNYEDFQARRGNIRYRRTADKKVDFVHTLNGSGLATPRLMVALLETYQTPDGKVLLPQVLQELMGLEGLG